MREVGIAQVREGEAVVDCPDGNWIPVTIDKDGRCYLETGRDMRDEAPEAPAEELEEESVWKDRVVSGLVAFMLTAPFVAIAWLAIGWWNGFPQDASSRARIDALEHKIEVRADVPAWCNACDGVGELDYEFVKPIADSKAGGDVFMTVVERHACDACKGMGIVPRRTLYPKRVHRPFAAPAFAASGVSFAVGNGSQGAAITFEPVNQRR